MLWKWSEKHHYYSGIMFFFILLFFLSGCLLSAEKESSDWQCNVNSEDLTGDGLPDKITCYFEKISAGPLKISRIISYNILYTFEEGVRERAIFDPLSFDPELQQSYNSVVSSFEDVSASCKSQINYPATYDCISFTDCVLACKQSKACEAFLSQNVEKGVEELKSIGQYLYNISNSLSAIKQMLINGDNRSVMNELNNLKFQYASFNLAVANTPCAFYLLDVSVLDEFYSQVEARASGKVVREQAKYAKRAFISAQDQLNFDLDENIYTFLVLNTEMPFGFAYHSSDLGIPGEFSNKDNKFTYSYSGTKPVNLSGQVVIRSRLVLEGNNTSAIANNKYPFSVSLSYIPQIFLGSLYVALLGPIDAVFQVFQAPFGYAMSVCFFMVTIYLLMYLVLTALPLSWTVLKFSIFSNRVPLKTMLLKVAGKPLNHYYVYIVIGVLLSGASLFFVSKEKIYESTSDYAVILAAKKFFGGAIIDLVFSLCFFAGFILFFKGLVDFVKRMVLGNEYSISEEEKLRLQFVSLQKEIQETAEKVKSDLEKLKNLGYDCTKFIDAIADMPIQRVFDVKQQQLNSMGTSSLNSLIALANNVLLRLKSLSEDIVRTKSYYEASVSTWELQIDELLSTHDRISISDLSFIPEEFRAAVLEKYYKKLDANKYGFQKNLIYAYPKDYVESSVFASLITVLEKKGLLYESGVFSAEGEILEDKLHRSSSRTVIRVMLLRLMKSVGRIMELTYAKGSEYVLINLSTASVLLLWGRKRILFFVIDKDIDLTEILGLAKPLLYSIYDDKK